MSKGMFVRAERGLTHILASETHRRAMVLIMIVGVWRSERCGQASLVDNLLNVNAHVDFTLQICTEEAQRCSTKHKFGCGRSRTNFSFTSVGESIGAMYPAASVTYTRLADIAPMAIKQDADKFAREGASGSGFPLQFNPLHFVRAKHCFEAAMSRYGEGTFDAAMVLRPDVIFTQPLRLPLHRRALSVILGHYRRSCVFAERDFDFGYLGVPPTALATWFRSSSTAVWDPQPSLPAGFNGTWLPHPYPAAAFVNCGHPSATRSSTAAIENKIRELEAEGMPLAAMHMSVGKAVFLMVVPSSDCEATYKMSLGTDTPDKWWPRMRSRSKYDMPACLITRLRPNRTATMTSSTASFEYCCKPSRGCYDAPGCNASCWDSKHGTLT